ncbi:MAG TPA: hypothetical protein VN709_06450 [Terriglobales bacterium]|nr:hypothetical protein [Terriglobales bacterium]
MRRTILVLVAALTALLYTTPARVKAQTPTAAYPTMAPLAQYLIPNEADEVALARSAAPASISSKAEVMVLRHDGYAAVAKGSNGFLCLVERSWGAATSDPNFWDPKTRGPICFNPASARSFAPIYLMKTKLALAGKSKADIARQTGMALDNKQLPTLEPGAMCYMLSRRQHLNDGAASNWHPHLMFFVSGDAAKSWGADLPGSPVISSPDPEERATILMVVVGKWSDGGTAYQAPAR